MKSKILKNGVMVLLLSLSIVNTVWGSSTLGTEPPQRNVASIIKEGINARGQYIALGMLEINNNGNGYIGIFIQTLAHEDVDKIKQRVYLDKYDDNTDKWKQVAYYDFEYLSEDYGGALHAPYEDFEVRGVVGSIYRVRGTHAVWKNGVTESFHTETDGIKITR